MEVKQTKYWMNLDLSLDLKLWKKHRIFKHPDLLAFHQSVILHVQDFFLIGHCAEFNLGGATVQDNYDADCTKHDPPCPSSFNSAEAYKCDFWKL